jgi:hypothetical protein
MKTPTRKLTIGSALAGLVAIGSFGLANAQTDTDTTTDTGTSTDDTVVDPADPAEPGDRPERTEELLTGDIAEQVTEAALAAVPGGTVERVETDDDGATYEAHMTDADGNRVTVTFDADVNVVEIQKGGPGGRGDGRGHGRHGDCGDADEAADDGADATADDGAQPAETDVEEAPAPDDTNSPVDTSDL